MDEGVQEEDIDQQPVQNQPLPVGLVVVNSPHDTAIQHHDGTQTPMIPGQTTFLHADVVNISYPISVPSQGQLSQEEIAKKVDEFIKDLNARTREQAKSTIARDFDDAISEPENEVTPVLVKTNFFRGDATLDEVDYSVAQERGRKVKKSTRDVEVFLTDIHKHGRYIMLIGGAGSGKTTLIKRYCNLVLRGEIESMKHIKVIYLLNIRDLPRLGEKSTPKEMLFGKFLIGEHKKILVKYGYEWLQNEDNQEQVLIALDGVDTAPWILTEDSHAVMNYDDMNDAPTIIYNILYGQLFPKCKLLLTSREYGITRFPRAIRPSAVVALKGLTKISIMTLVKELGGDRGDDIWKTLQKKSVNLMLLCSTPLFLIFTIIVYKKQENPPENLSGIIISLVENHIHSEGFRVKPGEIRGIVEKLKTLSEETLLDGKVVFNHKEFENVELIVEQVKDLIISVPTPSRDVVCNQKLLEEDYSFFFCHQAVQESLAALSVAGKPFEKFKEFVDNFAHSPKFIVVRQILCGVMFNKEATRLAEKQSKFSDKKKKKQYLLETLKEQLVANQDSPLDMLNLLISLRECGEEPGIVDMIRKTLSKLSLSGIPLTPSDLHAVASVTKHCELLSIIQLVNCHLNNFGLEVLADGLRGSEVEITVFDVSFNRNLRKGSMYNLHEICIRGQGLNYWQCGFRQIDILHFNEREAQIRMLNETSNELSEDKIIEKSLKEDQLLDLACYNVENYFEQMKTLIEFAENEEKELRASLIEYEEDSDVSPLCALLKKCKKIGELSISECEFVSNQLSKIGEALDGKQIDSLNVFLNPNIEEKGWSELGKIAKNRQIKNLFITASSLTQAKLLGFKISVSGWMIYKLDISRNNNMDEHTLKEVGEIVVICCIKELVMGYCNFKAEHIKSLWRSIRTAKIKRIDVSGNDRMGEEGFYTLGEISAACEVKQLDVSECDPSPEEVRKFKEGSDGAQITKLNVSRNRHMGEAGLRDVGELVGLRNLEELFIRQCELEEKTLESFWQGLGESTIPYLDLGFYFMKVRKTTDKEIEIIKKILPHVTKQLTLNDWDINEKGRGDLQKALDSSPNKDLKLMFNRGNNEYITPKQQ